MVICILFLLASLVSQTSPAASHLSLLTNSSRSALNPSRGNKPYNPQFFLSIFFIWVISLALTSPRSACHISLFFFLFFFVGPLFHGKVSLPLYVLKCHFNQFFFLLSTKFPSYVICLQVVSLRYFNLIWPLRHPSISTKLQSYLCFVFLYSTTDEFPPYATQIQVPYSSAFIFSLFSAFDFGLTYLNLVTEASIGNRPHFFTIFSIISLLIYILLPFIFFYGSLQVDPNFSRELFCYFPLSNSWLPFSSLKGFILTPAGPNALMINLMFPLHKCYTALT